MTSKWLSVEVARVDPDPSCELPFCPPGPYVPVEGDRLTKEAEYIEPQGESQGEKEIADAREGGLGVELASFSCSDWDSWR